MKISKERYERLKRGARTVGRGAVAGAKALKGPLMAGAGGAGFAILHEQVLKDLEFVQQNWWARGIAGVLAAMLLRRVLPAAYADPLAFGMAGAAGAAFYDDYVASGDESQNAAAVFPGRYYADAGAVFYPPPVAPAIPQASSAPDAAGFYGTDRAGNRVYYGGYA